MSNIYETDRLLAEYLLFHYGTAQETMPYAFGPMEALDFPARCARLCFDDDAAAPQPHTRALDIGCAVGRATFELARNCESVTGIDFSQRFIEAACELKMTGTHWYRRMDEGSRTTECAARVPEDIRRDRISFETGDAMDLRDDLGAFEIVLAANLLCRLPKPAKFLARLPLLVKPGGRLVITTPCTWLEDFTPRAHWLCSENSTTLDGLHRHLDAHFDLNKTLDLPFVIREHARKFQWTVAQASIWTRR